jgi:hypothetical protein
MRLAVAAVCCGFGARVSHIHSGFYGRVQSVLHMTVIASTGVGLLRVCMQAMAHAVPSEEVVHCPLAGGCLSFDFNTHRLPTQVSVLAVFIDATRSMPEASCIPYVTYKSISTLVARCQVLQPVVDCGHAAS